MKNKPSLKKNILIVIGIVIGIQLLYLVALLPIYSLVGDTTKSTDETDAVLRRSEIMVRLIAIVGVVAIISIIIFVVKKHINKARSRTNGRQQ